MLSNSSYPTISTGYLIRFCLISFLENKDSSSTTLINLKKYIEERTNHHLVAKISKEQNEAMLIAAFLDPKTIGILNDKDLKNAKKLIKDKRKNFEPEIVKEVSNIDGSAISRSFSFFSCNFFKTNSML